MNNSSLDQLFRDKVNWQIEKGVYILQIMVLKKNHLAPLHNYVWQVSESSQTLQDFTNVIYRIP